jgi:signal transduction histidine kinase
MQMMIRSARITCMVLAVRILPVEDDDRVTTAFVADASHQLRNPLNALLLRLDDLAMWASPTMAGGGDACR